MPFFLPNSQWRQVGTSVGDISFRTVGAVRVATGPSEPAPSDGQIYGYRTRSPAYQLNGGNQSLWIKSHDVGQAKINGMRSAIWVEGSGTFEADDVLPVRSFDSFRPLAVFLVAGQSNATSRATFDNGDDYPSTVFQWGRNGADDGKVIPAERPLQHHTAPVTGGMGWDLQFALEYTAANPKHDILLVPSAEGGTSFYANDWNPGDPLFNDAVSRVNAALSTQNAFLAGILWHQGESDEVASAEYEQNLHDMIAEMRRQIAGASSVPFILGGLVPDWVVSSANRIMVQSAIESTPQNVPYTGYASSVGLGAFDGIHFTAASYRTLGTRYFNALSAARTNVVIPGSAPPGVPAVVTATPGNGEITLSWTAPASTGDGPVTDYLIEISRNGGSSWSTVSDGVSAGTSYTVTGLMNGAAYTFRVSAVNQHGVGSPSAPVSGTPIETVPTGESGAVGHWLLGSDNVTFAGGSLTTVGAAPDLQPAYADWPGTSGRGYDTGISDGTVRSYWAVVRLPAGSSGNCVFGGNTDLSSGRVMFYSDTNTTFRLRTDPGGNLYDIDGYLPKEQWVFVAVSINGTQYTGFSGDSSSPVVTTGAISPGTLKGNIGISDIGLNNPAVSAALHVAEFGVFDTALTGEDWQAVYDRSVQRMAARSITVK